MIPIFLLSGVTRAPLLLTLVTEVIPGRELKLVPPFSTKNEAIGPDSF